MIMTYPDAWNYDNFSARFMENNDFDHGKWMKHEECTDDDNVNHGIIGSKFEKIM